MIRDPLLSLLEAAAEAGARRALELCESSPHRLVPVKEAPVPYRTILTVERAGELRIYRRGRSAFVALDELEEWIMRAPGTASERSESEPDETDEIGDLINISRGRR